MSDERGAVAIYEGAPPPMTVADMKAQVNLIQDVMRSVMKENEHYGVIPGTNKPSLLKAGAEKLIMTFRLVPDIDEQVIEFDGGHREYRIKVRISSQNGIFLGSGVGSCSTMEGKYRFRTGPVEFTGKPVPKAYWDMRKEDPAKAQQIIGGKGYSTKKNESGVWEIVIQGEKVEHDNPADYYNTCLKMAKKRALVDAILTCTAASDIFTQDIEDMTEVIPGAEQKAEGQPNKKPPIQQPQEKATEDKAVTETITAVVDKVEKSKKSEAIFVTSGDLSFSTFDKKLAEAAKALIGQTADITYTVSGKYKNLTAIAASVSADPEGCTQSPTRCDYSVYAEDSVVCGENGPECKYKSKGDAV